MYYPARLFLRYALHRWTRYTLAWFVALATTGITLYTSWIAFDSPLKADGTPARAGGNNGHTMIDFGGQWTLGRMFVLGLGEHLYDRRYQRPVLQEGYPVADEASEADKAPEDAGKHEAESLMNWFMGRDDPEAAQALASLLTPLAGSDPLSTLTLAIPTFDDLDFRMRTVRTPQIGGPLYPPVHALVMAPLGRFPPHVAYRIVQIVGLSLAFVCGWLFRTLSNGQVWWPVAATAVMVYPGFGNTLNLGQNPIIMLTLLVAGWTAMARGRPGLGGFLWGCLAFKPTWAVAFFGVALLTRRWRVVVFMAVTGAAWVLATLPFVGWRVWIDWLQVGKIATEVYKTDQNWIFLSRDLVTIPRRWLLDFQTDPSEAVDLTASIIGWSFVALVMEPTIRLAIWRRHQAQAYTGHIAAFVLLGGWFACFHFMFYDVLLTALPVLVLLVHPRRFLQPHVVALVPLAGHGAAEYYKAGLAQAYPVQKIQVGALPRQIVIYNSVTLSLIALLLMADHLFPVLGITVSISGAHLNSHLIPLPLQYSTGYIGTPWVTFTLVLLWVWCARRWLKIPYLSPPAI
jgi:hypothetical protein